MLRDVFDDVLDTPNFLAFAMVTRWVIALVDNGARISFALFRAASSDHAGVLPILMKRWRSLMR
jgi:hypothetical protein